MDLEEDAMECKLQKLDEDSSSISSPDRVSREWTQGNVNAQSSSIPLSNTVSNNVSNVSSTPNVNGLTITQNDLNGNGSKRWSKWV